MCVRDVWRNEIDKSARVILEHSLELGNRNELKEKIAELLAEDFYKIVIDFKDVKGENVDSPGFGSLVSMTKRVRERAVARGLSKEDSGLLLANLDQALKDKMDMFKYIPLFNFEEAA